MAITRAVEHMRHLVGIIAVRTEAWARGCSPTEISEMGEAFGVPVG